MSTKTFYITTPIYYVNDKPHIGHAYTSVAADVLARFKRLDGYKTLFLTGTDEHGQKIARAASDAGISAQDFCNQVSQTFKDLNTHLAICPDDFIRTTEDRHKKAAQALWKRMMDKGFIYKGSYAGWYSVRDEAYYAEDELINGKAPTGADVTWLEEESYFFALSKFQEPLLTFYKTHTNFIKPEGRRNEVIKFVESGLRDLSISRSTFNWGVDVPGDEKHVMYVWVDALTNYITALGFPENTEQLKDLWPTSLHLIGKDILRFHAIYWPAFLMAADLAPPHRIFAHGWWTSEGQKISKSLGNTIDPLELVQEFGQDAVRYFLMREVPFGQDGNFARAAFTQRYNSDLANDLGNLSQRVLSFVQKNANAQVPTAGTFLAVDTDILSKASQMIYALRDHADAIAPHRMLEEIWHLISLSNRYVDEQAPWSLRKTDTDRMNTVLYVLLEVLRSIGLYVQPFLPDASQKLLDMLGVENTHRTFATQCPLTTGQLLPVPQGLFPRLTFPLDPLKA